MGNEHDQWKKHEQGLRDDLFRKVEWLKARYTRAEIQNGKSRGIWLNYRVFNWGKICASATTRQ